MIQAGETCSSLDPHTPIWPQLQVPKVGWRKGTVVHREQMVKVPTREME